VLKGIQQGLALPAGAMIPSFAALRDYGNTSCSTTWYVLAYTETCRDVRRGEVVLQVGGAGVRGVRGAPLLLRRRGKPGHLRPVVCGPAARSHPIPPRLRRPAATQCGMGGGMEAGVNIWRALRDIRCVHPTWRHLAGKPLTEADLPRGIEAITADQPQEEVKG
jgi:hypothetical protein